MINDNIYSLKNYAALSRIQNDTFTYPVIYYVYVNSTPHLMYANFKYEKHYVPKCIIAGGNSGIMLDLNGDYGLTNFAIGIYDDVENLKQIYEVCKTKRFRDIIFKYLSVAKIGLDKTIFKHFKKDFWKEFI